MNTCPICKSKEVTKKIVAHGFLTVLYEFTCPCGWRKLKNHKVITIKRRQYAKKSNGN